MDAELGVESGAVADVVFGTVVMVAVESEPGAGDVDGVEVGAVGAVPVPEEVAMISPLVLGLQSLSYSGPWKRSQSRLWLRSWSGELTRSWSRDWRWSQAGRRARSQTSWSGRGLS